MEINGAACKAMGLGQASNSRESGSCLKFELHQLLMNFKKNMYCFYVISEKSNIFSDIFFKLSMFNVTYFLFNTKETEALLFSILCTHIVAIEI